MIGAVGLDGFMGGLLIGVAIGVLAGPVIRYVIAWGAWSKASSQASLTEPVLRRMSQGPWRFIREREAAPVSSGSKPWEDE